LEQCYVNVVWCHCPLYGYLSKKDDSGAVKAQQLELGYQQKLMEARWNRRKMKRRRLAGDLHDSIGGMLSTIRVGLTSIGRQIDHPEIINQPKQMLDDTISSVRRISLDLMPQL
jgi:signal transduction histidine kinase